MTAVSSEGKHYSTWMGYRGDDDALTAAGKSNLAINVTLCALLVLGCVTAPGVLSASSMGWSAVGLGSGALLILAGGVMLRRQFDVVTTALVAAAMVTIGALGGTGVLSHTVVGYTTIGIVLAHTLFYGIIVRGVAERERRAEERASEGTG